MRRPSQHLTRPSVAGDRSGKVKVVTLIGLALIGVLVYYGLQFGGVYFRKYKLEEAVRAELSYAGQRADDAIRQRLMEDIRGMNLPRGATNFSFARVQNPRGLRVSISYVETVNLLFTTKPIRISVDTRRRF